MSLSLLDHFLISQLFAFMMLFCRLGSAVMLFPAIGDSYVSPRIRLLFALMFALVLTPMFMDRMPPMPQTAPGLTFMILAEVTTGLAIGLMVRIILSAMHVAGTIISFQSSLSIASQFDMNSGGQSAVVSNFLTLMSIVIFLQLDLHHILFNGLVTSYNIFPVGSYPDMGDMTELNGRLASSAFMMGIQLAAPHLVFGLILYLGGGLMARLMPQMQVFYVLMSPQIVVAFILLIAVLSGMMMVHTQYAENALDSIFATEAD